MKMFKRYIAFLLLLCPVVVFAAANDNKILLDQAGFSVDFTRPIAIGPTKYEPRERGGPGFRFVKKTLV